MNRSILRYLLGVLIILAISLGVFTLLMSPPLAEIRLMALFLFITALVSSAVGYAAYRFGWLTLSPTIRWTLLIGYALSAALTFFNVWFSAQLMFASKHDLLLAIVLLVFASGMAMVLGFFISSALTDRIHQVKGAADSLAEGNLETRVTVNGKDEVAALGKAFNEMATRLQDADQKQRELEQARKDLIAWASHDLQTPLASIRAILEALADGVVEEPDADVPEIGPPVATRQILRDTLVVELPPGGIVPRPVGRLGRGLGLGGGGEQGFEFDHLGAGLSRFAQLQRFDASR